MKFQSGRLALSIGVFTILGFIISTIPDQSQVIASQQRPQDKPKLQKPGQPPPKEDEQINKDDVVRIGTDLVVLDVSVVDPSNKPVMDLKKEDFGVAEDKVPQKVD